MIDDPGKSAGAASPSEADSKVSLGIASSSDDYDSAATEKTDEALADPEQEARDAVTSRYLKIYYRQVAAGRVEKNVNSTATGAAANPPSVGSELERPILIGRPVLSEESPPRRWWGPRFYGAFASAVAIAMVIVLHFDTAFFGEETSQTAPAETAIATTSLEAEEARIASKIGGGLGTTAVADVVLSEGNSGPSVRWDVPFGANVEFDDKLLRLDTHSEVRMSSRRPAHTIEQPSADSKLSSDPPPGGPELEKMAAIPDARPSVDAIRLAPIQPQTGSTPPAIDSAPPSDLSVNRITVTRGVVGREPIDSANHFATSDGEVFAHAQIENTGARTDVTFTWYLGDRLVETTKLKVGQSDAWRTWSRRDIEPGNWRVQVSDEAGRLLARSTFIVE